MYIFKLGPNLFKESAPQKLSESVAPIYVKKSSQNTYIGSSLLQKINLNILVPHFAYFKVVGSTLWSQNWSKIASTNQFLDPFYVKSQET